MPIDNDFIESLPSGYRINNIAHYCQNTKPTGSAIAVGDRWYKSVDGSDWYWNGSYWLSTNLFYIKSDYNQEEISITQNLSGAVFRGRDLSTGQSGIYFVSATIEFYPYYATSATDYWSFTHEVFYSDGSFETVATNSGASKTGSSWTQIRTVINSPKNSLTKALLFTYCSANKVGNPSTMVAMSELEFRHIHP